MKKFFTFIAAMLFAGSMMAQVTITPADFTPVETSDYSTTVGGVTVAVTASTVTADQMRIFKNQTITISAESNITGIVFTCTASGTAKYGPGCFAAQDGYTFEADGTTGTWAGSATSVTFTASTNQVRATQIVVTLEGGEPVVVDTYTVAGNDAAIFGTSWDVTNTANDMVKAAGIYKWEKAELNLTAGTIIEFKVAKNHSWDIAYPSSNYEVSIAEEGEYTLTITFDPATEAVAAEAVKKVALADPTNCAEAAAAALTVSGNNVLYNDGAVYTINGFVTAIQTAYSDQYHNITFWMADAADGGNVLEAYRAACASEADAPAVGDKVAVTGKLTKYGTTPEFAAGCTFTIIERAGGEEPPVQEEIVITDTLTIAEAMEIGMALDSMATSEEIYAIEGYVINPGAFSLLYKNQSWYMADDATAAASDFQAYNCFPIQGNDTLKVLAGDKVQLVGKLKKYYNKNAAQYIIEVEKGNASFISMADGDHTVVVTTEEITVARALEIGNALAAGGVTEKQYKIRGYVSAINVKASDAYSESYKNQSFYVADAATSTASSNAEGAFYVYRGKPETEAEIPVGTQVEFTCTIKKYAPAQGDPVIENADQNIVIKILGDVTPVEDADVVFDKDDFAGQGQAATQTTPGGAVSATKSGVTFTCDNAYGDGQYGVRCYQGGNITISSTEQQIGKIVFEFATVSGKYYNGGLDEEIVVNGMEWSATGLASQARMNKIKIYFGEYEAATIDTITVAQAVEIGMALEDNATTEKDYVVAGWVVQAYAPNEGYTDQTWFMADEAGAYGEFEAYRCTPDYLVENDQFVYVKGKIQKYVKDSKVQIEIGKGTATHLYGQGVENVVLTEQAQKVVVDGVIYIVRDGKMFNLQGAQVR